MLISQIIRPDGSLAVVARDGSESAIVKGAASTYALAQEALASGRSIARVIAARGLGEAVDMVRLAEAGAFTLPITHPDPQALLDSHAGTGQQIGATPVGQPGSKERVDFGTPIGEHRDASTGTSTPTTVGIIHYSKNGAHIVPARPAGSGGSGGSGDSGGST